MTKMAAMLKTLKIFQNHWVNYLETLYVAIESIATY